jgi:hypothetical protein
MILANLAFHAGFTMYSLSSPTVQNHAIPARFQSTGSTGAFGVARSSAFSPVQTSSSFCILHSAFFTFCIFFQPGLDKN